MEDTMRALVLAALFALTLNTSAHADTNRQNTLTLKEIADGWILLFDGETPYGWSVPPGSSWAVKDGAIVATTANASTLTTTTRFSDFDLEAEVSEEAGAKPGIGVVGEGLTPSGGQLN